MAMTNMLSRPLQEHVQPQTEQERDHTEGRSVASPHRTTGLAPLPVALDSVRKATSLGALPSVNSVPIRPSKER